MIVDVQGRRFRNLRVSLTAACNYACGYCVPNGKRLIAAQDELTELHETSAWVLVVAIVVHFGPSLVGKRARR